MSQETVTNPFENVVWHSAKELGVRGRGWPDEECESIFHRLPARAQGLVREKVWKLATTPSGLHVRFLTNAMNIYAKWCLGEVVMPNLRTKQAALIRDGGMDCYGRNTGEPWKWVGTTTAWKEPLVDGKFNSSPLDGNMREYLVYIGCRRTFLDVFIGVTKDARLELLPPETRKPIVYYGTSIVHGMLVSRAGMTHANQLQRRLDYPIVNLGFAGNGKMEPEVAELIAEIDARFFAIDCLPNMSCEMILQNTPRLIEIVRNRWPNTPLLFIGDRLFGDAAFQPQRLETQRSNNESLRAALEPFQTDWLIHSIFPDNPFGEDMDGTLDGSHPTDLGAWRMANALEGTFRKLLETTNR